MKPKINKTMRTFELQNLLYKKDGKITGAMSPVLSANAFVNSGNFPNYTGLARIYTKTDGYSDIEINQRYEGSNKQDLTGYDQLLIVSKRKNKTVYSIFMELGGSILPIALYYSDDKPNDFIVTPIYNRKSKHFESKFSNDDIKDIFQLAKQTNLSPQEK